MYWLLLILLGAAFAWPFIGSASRSRVAAEDLLEPAKIAGVLLAIRVLPFYARAALLGVEGALDQWVRANPALPNPDEASLEFALLQVLAFASLFAGTRSRFAKRSRRQLVDRGDVSVGGDSLRLAALLSVAGALAFATYVRLSGSLEFILQNLADRSGLQAGQGYLTHTYVFLMTAGALVGLSALRHNRTRPRVAIVLVLLLLAASALTLTGGRSFVVQLVFLGLVVWHYRVKQITRLKPALLGPLGVAAVFVVALPVLRAPGGYDLLKSEPGEFVRQVAKNAPEIGSGNAYADTQIFIVGHFRPENIWWGTSFLGLLTAPIPRGLMPDKPPVDDGVYVFSLIQGIDARPPMPHSQLSVSAWPPATFGAMYMNFWVPGVVIGSYFLGIIYGLAHRFMRRHKYNIAAVIGYGIIMWRFQLSSLNIALTLVYLLMLAPLLWVTERGGNPARRQRVTREVRQVRAGGVSDASG